MDNDNVPLEETLAGNNKQINTKDKIKKIYQTLPDKKRYLEFVIALLTIPMLVMAIMNSTKVLQSQDTSKETGTSSQITPIIIEKTVEGQTKIVEVTPTPGGNLSSNINNTPTPILECKKEVGPIAIIYPKENQTVTSDPICVDITRSSGNYCSVVWSYNINGGPWSDFMDKSICMYGLTPGQKTFQLRVRSVASSDEEILTRNFVVGSTLTPTNTQAATSSANN